MFLSSFDVDLDEWKMYFVVIWVLISCEWTGLDNNSAGF